MRIELLFMSLEKNPSIKIDRVNKHAFQGLVYKLLQGTEFSDLHDKSHTKLFSFSDWFATKDKGISRIFISSPVSEFVKTLEAMLNKEVGRLVFKNNVLIGVKRARLRVWDYFQTASPVVLVLTKSPTRYYSFRDRTLSLNKFEQLVRDGAVRRYRASTGEEDFILEEPLFEELSLRREVAVPVRKKGRSFPIIGSEWSVIKFRKDRSLTKFYSWLTEAGIGQKCSMGFGFLQNKTVPVSNVGVKETSYDHIGKSSKRLLVTVNNEETVNKGVN